MVALSNDEQLGFLSVAEWLQSTNRHARVYLAVCPDGLLTAGRDHRLVVRLPTEHIVQIATTAVISDHAPSLRQLVLVHLGLHEDGLLRLPHADAVELMLTPDAPWNGDQLAHRVELEVMLRERAAERVTPAALELVSTAWRMAGDVTYRQLFLPREARFM